MEGIEHKIIPANGINIHIAEKGQGPTILFLHGFPELWYSWRHQLLYFASHGYRAVAPDLRGFGDTDLGPLTNNADHSKFTTIHVVADIVALIDAITEDSGEKKVFVVGHDWGAYMAWFLCLYRPDKVKALVNLSVHYFPRKPDLNLVEVLRAVYGNDHYMIRFQKPGDIEEEFASIGTKKVLKIFMTSREPGPYYFPKGQVFGDSPLPSWLSEEDVEYYTSKFDKTGFTGGVNYYRALNLDWELNGPWTGAQVTTPAKFVVGDLDLVYHLPGAKEYIHNGEFHKDVPNLEEVVVIEGAAHFINQEKPDEISKHIHDFLLKF